jgi:hypothetical protein
MRTVLGTSFSTCLAACLAVVSVSAIGCGESSHGGNGTGGTGNNTGGGGKGGSNAGTFKLTGKVQQLQQFPAAPTDDDAVGTVQLAPKIVTHVLAVNPSSQNLARVVSPVGADGAFTLALEPGHPWVLVFVDSSRVGADMIAGIFKASTLDTVAPTMAGTGDLGMVAVMPDGTAAAGIAYNDLLLALHLSSDDADLLGASDDVCLRYVNPDIDGDGVIDQMQPGHGFLLDFHVHFGMRVGMPTGPTGASATIDDILGNFLPSTTPITYGGVGIYVTQPAAFSPVDASTAWATFDEPITYYPGGSNPSARTAPAGDRIPGSDLMLSGGGDARSEGISAAAGADMPQGTYAFGVGTHTLTFTNVRTHSDAQLTAAVNFIMPFIRLVPSDATCTSSCAIAAIDFQWMKRDAGNWVPATASELSLIVGESGGYISIVKSFDNGMQRFGFTIPVELPSGRIAWTSAGMDGATAADLAATTSEQICHLGLSYDDKLGMRMFGSIGNAPGTCPMM